VKLFVLMLSCVVLSSVLGRAQAIRFVLEDDINKRSIAYDSVLIVRERDSARIVTKGSSVNFSTVGVFEQTVVEPTVSVLGDHIECIGFTDNVR